MKFASAIRFGGQLIDAEACDYDSYKHLGLICPECKSPVFLRAAHDRTLSKSQESVKVPASFAHFKATDPAIAMRCERRVSTYSKEELEKKATIARNQRLRLIQRWFWSIFWKKAELDYNFQNEAEVNLFLNELPSIARKLCSEPLLNGFIETIRLNSLEQREMQCRMTIEFFATDKHPYREGGRVVKSIEFLSQADREFQTLISTEVLNFLYSPTNQSLLEQVLTVFYLRATDTEDKPKTTMELRKNILSQLILEVCWTDWAGEFEQSEQRRSQR